MPQDTKGNWVAGTESSDASGSAGSKIKVIRREQSQYTRGQLIMIIADRMFPRLLAFFKDKRDQSGMLLQPAHVRGLALNIAENLIKNRELQDKK